MTGSATFYHQAIIRNMPRRFSHVFVVDSWCSIHKMYMPLIALNIN